MAFDSKVILLDIDGTLFAQHSMVDIALGLPVVILPWVLVKIKEWRKKNYFICIITARPEILRPITETQLLKAGIVYDKLVMGIPSGVRTLVNDSSDPFNNPKALAYTVKTDGGLKELEI